MAISVPREVLERAARNRPGASEADVRFGTWNWRSRSINATSTTTGLVEQPSEPSEPTEQLGGPTVVLAQLL